ncbi:MAG: ketoacyl-ACP synthase III [Victivallaceae bacterium]|nr:ketoacyl-ACP synthase III [Victivallaceae bacterium]
MGIRVIGTGSYVPDKIMTNADLEKLVDTSDEWIRTRTGIEERRIASADQATSDLAVKAAENAMEMAGLTADQLDGIIVASISVDHVFPSTACIVQKKLGAANAMCFDLEAACSGLLYALEVGHALLTAKKHLKRIMVLGAEKMSSLLNWDDRNTCVLFGDGAGCIILEKDDSTEDCFIAGSLGANGEYSDILQIPAGGSACPATQETVANKEHFITMAGQDTFKLAVNSMVKVCRKVLEEAEMDASQIAWLVPHQANYRILKAVASRLKIPEEKVYINVNRFGNTSAASIGICLDEMVRGDHIKQGDYVLLTAFGGGLTWGAVLMKWSYIPKTAK